MRSEPDPAEAELIGPKPDESTRPTPGSGQVVLEPATDVLAPAAQVRDLNRLSDPALSELGLDDLLAEVLVRVRQALSVDTVAILLLEEDGNQLVARAASGIEEEVEQGVRIPVGRGFAGRIAAERVAIFIADVDHADILNPILREKGIRSMLGIPLITGGELIGVLHVGSLHPRDFDQKDLAILQVAAARIAPAIERASLFAKLEHEHDVAMMLQRSLLPGRAPSRSDVSVSLRYLPAREEVGGDWHDVIELPRGLLGIAIGDVVGHGIKAASLMGQLRTALHAYALEDHGPGRTLELVDRFVQSMGEYAMATVLYGVFDPETGRLTLATAGHLPPILISGGIAEVVELTPVAPLGGFPYGRCPEHELVLSPGDILVMYTDGLVERRGVPLTDGIGELAEAIAGTTSAEDACISAFAALVPAEGLHDDVAMLALESTTIPSELMLELPADPQVLAPVRRLVRRWLRAQGATSEEIGELALAINEACANAIEHAYSPAAALFSLEATATAGAVEVVVRDTGTWQEPRKANRGHGLMIMQAAMDLVDVQNGPDGTVVRMSKRLKLS